MASLFEVGTEMKMAPSSTSWNSTPLEFTYQALGWIAFSCWGVCFYPQLYLNFRRKSVVGLNFDFLILNVTKLCCYSAYNICLYFVPAVQNQYFDEYGSTEMIPVALSDVAMAIHALLLTLFAMFQVAIYERGGQKFSKICIVLVASVWLTAGICFFIALPTNSWLWLVYILNTIQVFMTVIKYAPQAIMNFLRKSTDGFSIFYILFDFTGDVANLAQMAVQSINQGSLVNFYGNIGKTMICLLSILFDLIFMSQHYLLYPAKKALVPLKRSKESKEPLIKSFGHPQLLNV
ncbi:cystinosin homolog [Ziziphus jujuba]|uniref:Cystinosin homolog n=2 Tax=Ziziphus jujuba TaxID=326968 RepID=A0A6P3ZRJ0_ZIZJJ|nr:cystinosin homolog [Ziziphus jujuba]KAH7544631.1 hypothetical protein FEM48_Zijuj01G0006100 [Ziziphus jujuba var. spinosa]